ncbi:MAG: AmpG family muropeptide MFS transporter [Succinivibrio sp.]
MPSSSVMSKFFSRKMALCLSLGFASGMPLFVVLTLLGAFLRKEGVDLKSIGLFSLMSFPYTWKFLWSPLVDRYNLIGIGRRKSWMLISQLLVFASIGLLGHFDPHSHLYAVAIAAFVLSFSSATQDIVIDAYRREILSDEELGAGTSVFIAASRASSLIPGGLSLILSDFMSWGMVFIVTAAFMLPALIITIFIKEPVTINAPRSLKAAIVDPFREFISRKGLGSFLLIILFVFFYKLGDSMATALATPFYIDMHYSMVTIGLVAKNAGLWSMVIGGILGGMIMLKIGINRALWIFGFGQMVTILGFVILARAGATSDVAPPIWLLAVVIVAECLGAGLGTAAFVSFLSAKTSRAFAATQFALLTSLSAVPRTFCNATTGYIVEYLGWENFFIFCTILAVPGMLLLIKVAPFSSKNQ